MSAAKRVDAGIKEWATETQKKYIDAVIRCGTIRGASRELGVDASAITRRLQSAEKRAAVAGYSPKHDLTHTVPSPFFVKGVSTLYGEDGKLKVQWVKTALDKALVEQAIRDFVSMMVEDARGISKYVPAPAYSNDDLLAAYPVGDPHFGMYAWAAEAGDDFDTDIASKITTGAFDRLIGSAPPASTAIILILGDLMHADDTTNRTPASGYPLDVDTRLQRVIRVALKTIKHSIYRALEKHKLVIVRIVAGNHDPHSSFTISLALEETFSNNKRVRIETTPSLFWYHRHGKVLIGATHGDKTNDHALLGVMASDRSEDWGQTKFRYFYHGHIHNRKVVELPGMMIESFRTLAPKDAWHAGKGYRAGRDMCLIVHHKEFGEVERHRCDVAMLGDEGKPCP